MRSAVIVILATLACATKPPTEAGRAVRPTSSSEPPDLTRYRLAEEGETGPSREELHPYVRQRPLIRVTQWDEPARRAGSYDLVVFDDGAAFFEGRHWVVGIGFRTVRLSGEKLAALREELATTCPMLRETKDFCTDSGSVAVVCHLGLQDYSGRASCDGQPDQAGRHAINVAATVLDKVGIRSWATPNPSGADRYAGGEIERTLSPIPWKRYVPAGGSGTDVQPGVAADGASPRH